MLPVLLLSSLLSFQFPKTSSWSSLQANTLTSKHGYIPYPIDTIYTQRTRSENSSNSIDIATPSCHGMSQLITPMPQPPRKKSTAQKAHYSPPWANTSIIGVAGSSGSGKTSLTLAIVASLNLPWVVILSMVS